MSYADLPDEDRKAMEEAEEGVEIIKARLRARMGAQDTSTPLSERVRAIANTPNPWIPGAQADLIREIAAALELSDLHIEQAETRGARNAYRRLLQEASTFPHKSVGVDYLTARMQVEVKALNEYDEKIREAEHG